LTWWTRHDTEEPELSDAGEDDSDIPDEVTERIEEGTIMTPVILETHTTGSLNVVSLLLGQEYIYMYIEY